MPQNRVESLYILYKILFEYSVEFSHLVNRAELYHLNYRRRNPKASEYKKIGEQLIAFWVFFTENRQYLPDETAEKVHQIYQWAKFLHEIAYDNLPHARKGEKSIYLQSLKYEFFEFHSLKGNYTDYEWDLLSYDDVFRALTQDMYWLAGQLDFLYHSVRISRDYKKQE